MKYNVSGSKFSISSLPIISTNLSIRRPISLLSTSELIFGGIVRCDLIAEGVVAAMKEVNINIPVVVRLEGNNADLGAQILSEANIAIHSINNLSDAANKAVELAKWAF